MDINTDRQGLARFAMDYVQDGVGEDGLPLYREELTIWTGRPPLTWIQRKVEDDDYDNFADEYRLF
jgi:hypothetical protein